jgi:mycothiol synthase
MGMLTVRSYANEADLQAIVDLVDACEAVDHKGDFYSVTYLRQALAAPDFDPSRDLCLWEDFNDQLVAFAKLWISPESNQTVDGYLQFYVHPNARGLGFENEAIAWSESRLGDVGQSRQAPVTLRTSARESEHHRIAVLSNCGFTYERCFLTMARSLTTPIPLPQFPDGFRLIDATTNFSTATWVEMFNQTFVDHWNFYPVTVEQSDHWTSDPQYRPELDLVAIAPDGTFAGFCYCDIDQEENQAKGQQEGWIDSLGTRRGFRRLGLARALLLSGLHRLQNAGMAIAKLGVDTENPNSAQNLYESVGFQKLYANLTYCKKLGERQ